MSIQKEIEGIQRMFSFGRVVPDKHKVRPNTFLNKRVAVYMPCYIRDYKADTDLVTMDSRQNCYVPNSEFTMDDAEDFMFEAMSKMKKYDEYKIILARFYISPDVIRKLVDEGSFDDTGHGLFGRIYFSGSGGGVPLDTVESDVEAELHKGNIFE